MDTNKVKRKQKKDKRGKFEAFYPTVVQKGGCKHNWEFAGDERSGAKAYSCTSCMNGILINPKTDRVKDGKLIKR